MKPRTLLSAILLVIAIIIVTSSIYYVDEREKAIVFQFGEIIRSDDKPGIHFKVPFINNIRKFDARIQTMDAEPESYLTEEKKNLIVDSFVKWRVKDAFTYYTTLGGLPSNARNRLSQRVNDALRSEFGRRNVLQVISGDRVEIMNVVRQLIDEESSGLGIEVIDVRLKRVDLDASISERVYQRMEAERSMVAKELRARGAEAAERVRADADRQRQVILANSNRTAQEVRGFGDATATKVYADAFGQDREFYRLYRSLSAYRTTFSNPSNLLVIEPKSEFFRYFNQASPSDTP
jgi:membrane protease subunit HflC